MAQQAKHPALEQAPKTLRQALERIVAYGEKNEMAFRQYLDDEGCHCAIGQFFTPAQLAEIRKTPVLGLDATLNSRRVEKLAEVFGKQNIEAMTGMNLAQAKTIQYLNDFAHSELLPAIRAVLNGEKCSIRTVEFGL
jgi:hypothetical protein